MMKKRPLIFLGDGGHATSLINIAMLMGFEIQAISLKNKTDTNSIDAIPKITDDELLASDPNECLLVNGIGSISLPTAHKEIYSQFKKRGFQFASLIHPNAIIADDTRHGEGCQLMAACIIQNATKLGENVIINTGAIIDHHGEIASHCHIATGATLCGSVKVGENSHIGAGATIIQGVTIGSQSVVAAGAVVTKDVPTGSLALGVPATHRLL